METVCAAVHHWSPAHGGVGLASGGSAPESDGCKCAEESVSLALKFYFYQTPRLPRGCKEGGGGGDD